MNFLKLKLKNKRLDRLVTKNNFIISDLLRISVEPEYF